MLPSTDLAADYRAALIVVGGSKRHGGLGLGPTLARVAWRELRVEARSLADAPPDDTLTIEGLPRLTTGMAARIQGFPDSWVFWGNKTAADRRIGNAFPLPVGHAVAAAIRTAATGVQPVANTDPELAAQCA